MKYEDLLYSPMEFYSVLQKGYWIWWIYNFMIFLNDACLNWQIFSLIPFCYTICCSSSRLCFAIWIRSLLLRLYVFVWIDPLLRQLSKHMINLRYVVAGLLSLVLTSPAGSFLADRTWLFFTLMTQSPPESDSVDYEDYVSV